MDNTTRKPMLLFQLSGSFLLRYEQRALLAVLFHEPPRSAGVGASLVVHSTQHAPSQQHTHLRHFIHVMAAAH
jgi:hypothetical protein